MFLSLGQAAKHLGISKPTLSKAISSGKISAKKREDGSYAIDPSELDRYRLANEHRFPSSSETPKVTPDTPPLEHPEILRLRELLEIERTRLVEAREWLVKIEADRDAWRQQATQLLLSPPSPNGWFARLFKRH